MENLAQLNRAFGTPQLAALDEDIVGECTSCRPAVGSTSRLAMVRGTWFALKSRILRREFAINARGRFPVWRRANTIEIQTEKRTPTNRILK
jgi:hypothetical protein